MKLRLVLVLLLFPLQLLAQRIDGVVLDKVTHRPVAFATVVAANSITATNADGRFSIPNIAPGDSLKITCIGYKVYKTGIAFPTQNIITIYMVPASILLNDVVVKSKHDPKLDSARVRKEFAAAFAYKRPTFKDMFITVDPYKYTPDGYIHAGNSTASLVSVNLLSLVNLLSKKSNDPNSKLQQTLLRDEETEFVDRTFSKQKIRLLTNLKGDSLLDFMDAYRPTIKQTKKMTDYEMVLYIKKSYADFINTYSAEKHSPFAK